MTDSLGDRMKLYESAHKLALPPRMPVIVRVDGKAFHAYTRGCEKPFDERLVAAMNATAIALCEHVQTAQIAYVQSDEISLLLHPYKRYTSQPWFGNELQKIVSVCASIAAATITAWSEGIFGETRPAFFDARAFVLPESEVANYFVWRQQDAERNSVQMLARSLFSHKECDRKNCNDLQTMSLEAGHDWSARSTWERRGRIVVREPYPIGVDADGLMLRWRWVVAAETPRFVDSRDVIDRLLATEPEAA